MRTHQPLHNSALPTPSYPPPLQGEGMAASANNNRRATRAKSFLPSPEPLPRETSWNPTVQHHPLPLQAGGWEGVTPRSSPSPRKRVLRRSILREQSSLAPLPLQGGGWEGVTPPPIFARTRIIVSARPSPPDHDGRVPSPIIAPCRNKGGGGRFAKRRSGSPKFGRLTGARRGGFRLGRPTPDS